MLYSSKLAQVSGQLRKFVVTNDEMCEELSYANIIRYGD